MVYLSCYDDKARFGSGTRGPRSTATPMTLRRKMSLQITAMIGGLLLVVAAALGGMRGLRMDLGRASAGYRELRDRYEVGFHVATAKTLMQDDTPDLPRVGAEIDAALTKLDLLDAHAASVAAPDEPRRLDQSLRGSLKAARAALSVPRDPAFGAGDEAAIDALNRALAQIAAGSMAIRTNIADDERAAHQKWKQTLTAVAGTSLAVVLISMALGVWQYRGVIVPLRRLGEAANRIAAGKLSDRVDGRGPAEFAEIAGDFNRMARELETLYRDLEAKVAAASKELVRSERLASVGHLATGVAHEINNPLSIITGYAERAIQQLERDGGGGASGRELALKSLRIACEEAYRCKQITDKLLSLGRPGRESSATRESVELGALMRDVVGLVEGLPLMNDRAVSVDAAAEVSVNGSRGKLKQVFLNLLVNALEAVPAGTGGAGRVIIRVETAEQGMGRVTVADNGRGMSGEVVEKVFEPFFTDKRGAAHPGTGLGLSIAHAIVQAHGGRLTAQSEGAGKGSTFTLELPVEVGQTFLSASLSAAAGQTRTSAPPLGL